MTRPLAILDPHFRSVDELFSPASFARLGALCRLEVSERPMPRDRLDGLIETADFLIAARPRLDGGQIARAHNLKAAIEVAGAFHEGLDYATCFARGIEVLSCAPGFRRAVAEMGLALILAAARGVVAEHEAFRRGDERWVDDCPERDLSLFGRRIGFVGYGNIAEELHRLLRPFAPVVSAHDPWRPSFPDDVTATDLAALCANHSVLVVTAVPTTENRGMIDAGLIGSMPRGAKLVLLSRAHCIDFDAAIEAARAGRITLASDVFPSEPVAPDSPWRRCPNVILSPHRAAAVSGGRRPIGDMILHDIEAILSARNARQLLVADPDRVASLVSAQSRISADGDLPNT